MVKPSSDNSPRGNQTKANKDNGSSYHRSGSAGLKTRLETSEADGKKLRGKISVLKCSSCARTSKIISQ
jgi:hypothetical protein